MDQLPRKFCPNSGLTLIEVLIALAIVSIALTAIVKSSNDVIRGTTYLQNKAIALLVGKEIMNEARVDIVSEKKGDNYSEHATVAFGKKWFWTKTLHSTPNPHIENIKVSVYESEVAVEENTPIVDLEGYLYHANSR